MLRTIQILSWMYKQKMTMNEIMEEFTSIVDNVHSQYFVLSLDDCQSIANVFENDVKFDRALNVAKMMGDNNE